MALKVLQVIAGGAQGGAEVAFVDTVLALHKAGLDQQVVVRKNRAWTKPLKQAGLVVHELPFSGFLDFKTKNQLKKIIANYHPTIVQTWMTRATKVCPQKNAQLNFIHVARLGGYYDLKSYGQANYLVANTPDIERYFHDHGWSPNRTKTIWNFAPIETSDEQVLRTDYQTPEDKPLLLALGRLHPNKAFDVLLKALALVPNTYLWIAGEGEERDNLQKLTTDLNLQDRVRFLGWQNNRAGLFAAADICVFPSRVEPFGNVAIQAFAYHVPLITTASEGPRQYVANNQDALVVPVDDVNALAAAMTKLISDKTLQDKLITAGYEKYQTRFSESAGVKAYLDFYQEIASRN